MAIEIPWDPVPLIGINSSLSMIDSFLNQLNSKISEN